MSRFPGNVHIAGNLTVDGTCPGGGPPGGDAFPVGAVFLSVVDTNPETLLGYGVWEAIGAGRVLVGVDAADSDFDAAGKVGGAKTVAGAGTVSEESAHTHSVTASVSVADHASHAHAYTQVPNHTHPITDPGHAHGTLRYPTATGSLTGFTIDTSMSGTPTANTLQTASTTTGITGTGNPAGGVASGTTGGPDAPLAHSVSAAPTVSSAGSAHGHTFTGLATSVVQPFLCVFMWQRTA